ncbi:hypothetical protein B0H11DRAFT_2371391 [Mycena galericulata]|nr:hypothetical protein B0H11DRAFT_1937151 [Mycena galericulata]KAJ7511178.1 hypothetical protein B0H11DRAFT_2215015 [Mycena galericulata]KAJ7511901.1 hypothetical protein B0H11DRAFT_2371391 [Mycena galericulata]
MDPLQHHPGRGLAHLRRVIRCLELYHFVLREISSLALTHRFSISDTQPFVTYGVHSFALSEVAAHGIWGTAQLVARFIHCAALGIDLTSRVAQFIPVHIPLEAIRDVGLAMPNISLVLGYPTNPFLRRRFDSRLAAIQFAELFCDWVDYYVFWVAECMRRTILKGEASVFDFGTALGIGRASFFLRVAEAGPAYPVSEGEDRRSEDTFFHTALDLEVARIIRPWYTHFGVMEGPTQVGVALYPIEFPLSGPMDVIMNSGFQKMELDYVEMRAARSELNLLH